MNMKFLSKVFVNKNKMLKDGSVYLNGRKKENYFKEPNSLIFHNLVNGRPDELNDCTLSNGYRILTQFKSHDKYGNKLYFFEIYDDSGNLVQRNNRGVQRPDLYFKEYLTSNLKKKNLPLNVRKKLKSCLDYVK